MLTCYLDSQDYSALTDPKTLTPERIACRDDLIRFAHERTVQFVFSAAAVSEGVSLTAEAAGLAESKAELLSELCGRNALASFDRVIRAEATALLSRHGPPSSMIDASGNWFPEIPVPEFPGTPWETMRKRAEDELATKGMSRQQRRAAARGLIKNGRPRGEFKNYMERQDTAVLAAELVKQYPMKPEYAEVVTRYCMGRAGEEEFAEALSGSLRDPRWMMKWFATNHALSSPVADIVRKPGRELGESLRKLTQLSVQWASDLRDSGVDLDPTGKRGEIYLRWQDTQDRLLVSLIRQAARSQNKAILDAITAEIVDQYCPGVSVTVRALYASVWQNIAGGRKEEPSDSQPVDALHAMYAPYVRVFRADRFMAPHIQKQVEKHGTIVVPRLAQLVGVLKAEIERAG